MGNGNFWQLFLGKEPYSKKSDFVKMAVKNAPAGKNLILLRHGYCGGLLPSLFYLF